MQDEHLPIIDSHIHLYPATHIPRLAWTSPLPVGHVLNQQNSVAEYRAAIKTTPQTVRGFIFVETDRISGVGNSQWTDPLEEVKFLTRIAKGRPIDGEGHVTEDACLLLGIVPWAPVVEGSAALSEYISRVKEACVEESSDGGSSSKSQDDGNDTGQSVFKLVRGFRYLVQDKPRGTVGQEAFIAGLAYLAQQDLTFDLGIDLRSGGTWQLDEAKDAFDRLDKQGGTKSLTLIINHFCKPNLRIDPTETQTQMTQHPEFVAWTRWIEHFAARKQTYMKLSGFFSELPEQRPEAPTELDALWLRVQPWVDVVFAAFGPARIMFGSDWPVCNAGGPGTRAWQHWRDLVAFILDKKGLNLQEKEQIWSETAVRAYGLA